MFNFFCIIILTVWSLSFIFAFSINSNLRKSKCVCGLTFIDVKIWNGIEADPHKFPWVVALYRNNNYFCSGSVINSRWILTAAHCFKNLDNLNVLAYYGSHNKSIPILTRKIKEVKIHEEFEGTPNFYHDIALLKNELHVQLSNLILPICFPSRFFTFPKYFEVSSWGLTEKGPLFPDILRKAMLIRRSDDYCKSQWIAEVDFKPQYQFCAGTEIQTCSGDSGSTLTGRKYGLYFAEGITSFGLFQCGVSMFPSIYTKVRSYISWVKKNMEGDVFCQPYGAN